MVQPLDVLDWFKKKSGSAKYLKDLCVTYGNVSHAELAINIFNAIIPTAVLFSKAIVQVVDFFLDDANQMARSEIATIHQGSTNEQDSSQMIMRYVREALRLRPLVSLSPFCLPTILTNASCSFPVSIALQWSLSLLIISSSRIGCLWILRKLMCVKPCILKFHH